MVGYEPGDAPLAANRIHFLMLGRVEGNKGPRFNYRAVAAAGVLVFWSGAVFGARQPHSRGSCNHPGTAGVNDSP